MEKKYSILFPDIECEYKVLSPVTIHDLGLDLIIKQLCAKEAEQNIITNIMSRVTADGRVAKYRADVFEDIRKHKKMREDMMEILGRINFLRDYGGFNREYDETASVWDLMHRLDEIKDYIECVDALYACLNEADLKSSGLKGLLDYVNRIYSDNGFGQLKKDIAELKTTTSNLKSVTVGINLNDRYEADGIGLISVNNKYFTKSGAISNFCDHIAGRDKISNEADWDGDYKYHQFTESDAMGATQALDQLVRTNIAMTNPLMAMTGIASVPEKDTTKDVSRYMDRVVNHMLSGMVKKLKETLNKYVTVTITDMTDLIPEFMYYIHWASYIEGLEENGNKFTKPEVILEQNDEGINNGVIQQNQEGINNDVIQRTEKDSGRYMRAKGIYNIKLAALPAKDRGEIITNDLDFDDEKRVYILTGANRGGKTTITQAVGQLFIMAQGGINVAADEFCYSPVDGVFTHFPADEDKTMDLGRLGEECSRFKEIYSDATKRSLLLLNETFSTTSFEEGYYIALDSVKAILEKGIRTIYNTHMHKLAFDIDEINCLDERTGNGKEGEETIYHPDGKAVSLVVANDGADRSYKVIIAPPQGKSFASDIALKYGVTFEMLTGND